METEKIEWTPETVRLGDLIPQPDNPRYTSVLQGQRIDESWEEYGQVETLAIGPDGHLYNGHQRHALLLEKYGPDYQVDVRRSSRSLSEEERHKLTIYLHGGATGDWDWDVLASWRDADQIAKWGLGEDRLAVWNDDGANLALFLESEIKDEDRVDLSDFEDVPDLDVFYRVIISEMGLEQAHALVEQIEGLTEREVRLEQYRKTA